MLYFILILIAFIVFILFATLRIVPEKNAYIIERLGKYKTTWNSGLHFKIPFIDRIARKVLLKEQVADFAPQPVITKDNVTMLIDSVVYFYVFDAEKYTYGVENPISAIENLTATTLRNIVGHLELDATLTSRENVNQEMLKTLDEATDPWGIKITRVELKNIKPPQEIQQAMEKQMKAERDKRSQILPAQASRESAILIAEGEKESTLLRAQAEKEATILRAEASREKEIKEAEGKAEAIRLVKESEAKGIELIKASSPDKAVLQLSAIKAFVDASHGKATKIIVPSDIQNQVGLLSSLFEGGVKDLK